MDMVVQYRLIGIDAKALIRAKYQGTFIAIVTVVNLINNTSKRFNSFRFVFGVRVVLQKCPSIAY